MYFDFFNKQYAVQSLVISIHLQNYIKDAISANNLKRK